MKLQRKVRKFVYKTHSIVDIEDWVKDDMKRQGYIPVRILTGEPFEGEGGYFYHNVSVYAVYVGKKKAQTMTLPPLPENQVFIAQDN